MANLELIKNLRESTGCGIADCNKALAECGTDLEAAIDWLRKKGLTKAAKKGDRVANEGLVGICLADNGQAAGMVEINSETDFVARNEVFQKFVQEVSKLTLTVKGDLENLKKATYPETGADVETESQSKTGVIGEKLTVRRSAYLQVDTGVVETYIHNKIADGMGKIGVLVALKSSADQNILHELGKNLAMHIAASKPEYLHIEDVDATVVSHERDICREQVLASKVAPEMVEKIVDGKMKNFYQGAVLLEQIYVIDGKKPVKDILAEATKQAGTAIELVGFKLFVLGEGIEKQTVDFASEVSAMTSK